MRDNASGTPAGRMRIAALLAAGFAALGAASLPAQDQAQPVFKSGVQVVAVDVRVTDRDGRPIGDLTAADFDVTIDGRPRKVESANFVTVSAGAPPKAAAPTAVVEPPSAFYSTNTGEAPAAADGRLIALLVDQGTFSGPASRGVVGAVQRFLGQLLPSDRVSLATIPGPGPRVPFTTNQAAVGQAVGRIVGTMQPWPFVSPDPAVSMVEVLAIARGDRLTESDVVSRECASGKSAMSLEACRQLIVNQQVPAGVRLLRERVAMSAYALAGEIEALGNLEGPKVAILVSAGLMSGERMADLDSDELVRAVGRAASAARVTIYVLHLDNAFLQASSVESSQRPGVTFSDAYMFRSGLEMLADLGGGRIQTVVAGADAAFTRIAREISASYVLGVASAPTDADGKPHRIQVRVRRPNVEVHSRTELIAPVTPATPPSNAERLATALASPGVARALPVSLAHVTLSQGPDRARVILSADIGRGVIEAADVDMGYVILDASGRRVGGVGVLTKRRLEPVGLGADASWSFVESVTVPPGNYTVKLAALDPAGRLGSVAHVVDARPAAGDGVTVSDLLIVDPAKRSASGGLAPTADGRITGLSLGVLLEVYAPAALTQTRVSASIAERPDGPPLKSADLGFKPQDEGRRVTAEGQIDIGMLPPGDYVASVEVFEGERRLARVIRPFRYEPSVAAGAASTTIAPRAAFYASATGSLARRFKPADALTTEALGSVLARLAVADPRARSGAAAAAAASIRDGRFDAAIEGLRDAPPDELATSFLRGLALLARNEPAPAREQFRAALLVSGEFLPAVFYLGACYAAEGRDRDAVGAWQTSLIGDSDARIVYDLLADALLRLADWRQALSVLEDARQRWPDDDLFLPRLAAAQALSGRRDEAVKTLVPYLDRHPDDAGVIMLAARVLFESHSAGKAAVSAAADRELAKKLSALYKAAQGPEQALLDRWVAFILQSRVGR